MEEGIKTTKTVFSVSQFLNWQSQGSLNLSPIFQRRQVWKAPAKSLLIDSILRGYPIPIILLRQVQNLDSLSMTMEVVDGQQRLRTLLAYIDPSCLTDFRENHDTVTLKRMHNAEFANKPFSRLPDDAKHRLLSYEMSTHIFPPTTGDDLVFRIFARLNSTGLSLKPQEVRNSEFHGAFKTLVYDLSFEHLDYWKKWKVFTNDAISRMDEAEGVSEYLLAMLHGISAKDQRNIRKYYRQFEDDLPNSNRLRSRFNRTIRAIDQAVGQLLANSAFRRPTLFYSLFSAVYDHMYGLGSNLEPMNPIPLPGNVATSFENVSRQIRTKDLPEHVQDAIDKATGDKTRRDQRQKFIMEALGLDPAS